MVANLQENVGVEREGSDQVDDVDGRPGEDALVGTNDETDGKLQREPDVAHLDKSIHRLLERNRVIPS